MRDVLAHGRLLLGPDLRSALRGAVTWKPLQQEALRPGSILVAISLTSWDRSFSPGGVPTASSVVTVGAICFALIKVRIIMREFMEVRGAPRCCAA